LQRPHQHVAELANDLLLGSGVHGGEVSCLCPAAVLLHLVRYGQSPWGQRFTSTDTCVSDEMPASRAR
jgi:hypothetical protein